ncbi:MAG: hypothetical protein JWM50_1303 [Microbacteriaceae bacterium]|jgi:uncharacterized protein (TIGR02271 family)|nr:hypothetical protein [Microbacteriaceae bacterium]
MINTNNVNDLIGATVYGSNDDKVGTVGQVYVDTETQRPLWLTVKTGLFGTAESFAPLEGASFDGDTVRLPFEKSFVKDAPRIADDGALSVEEEQSLYAYYGNSSATSTASSGDRTTNTGYDTSGPTTDDAMTRSEERLHVGTETVQTGRARLRKHIVTEMETVTVPVSHEEVTLTREPITEANVGDAVAGPDLSEEEHEVVLTTERVVVGKETVPVERVALGTETVTEQQRVSEEVAHEEIELVEPGTSQADNRA